MTDVLGYDRYLAQGGDWGGLVTSWLGFDHGAHARAIHLNMIGFRPPGGAQTEAESAWIRRTKAATGKMGAYLQLQTTKPQSAAWLAACSTNADTLRCASAAASSSRRLEVASTRSCRRSSFIDVMYVQWQYA